MADQRQSLIPAYFKGPEDEVRPSFVADHVTIALRDFGQADKSAKLGLAPSARLQINKYRPDPIGLAAHQVGSDLFGQESRYDVFGSALKNPF